MLDTKTRLRGKRALSSLSKPRTSALWIVGLEQKSYTVVLNFVNVSRNGVETLATISVLFFVRDNFFSLIYIYAMKIYGINNYNGWLNLSKRLRVNNFIFQIFDLIWRARNLLFYISISYMPRDSAIYSLIATWARDLSLHIICNALSSRYNNVGAPRHTLCVHTKKYFPIVRSRCVSRAPYFRGGKFFLSWLKITELSYLRAHYLC